MYNDFDEMDFWKCSHFLAGCFLTFMGVYLITSNRDKTNASKKRANLRTNSIADPFRAILPEDNSDYERRFSSCQQPPNQQPQHQQQQQQQEQPSSPIRRNTVDSSTPLIQENHYSSSYGSHSFSRNDSLLQSIVSAAATPLTSSVSQALNSVGTRHSHALGLGK